MMAFKTREIHHRQQGANTGSGGEARGSSMKLSNIMKSQEGKMGYILLWLLGVPIPILILIFLLRGCD
jgi:hypothetical protein